MNIIAAIEDPGLFKPFFKDPGTWRSWETYLRALFRLEIVDGAGLKLFRDSTGLEVPPDRPDPGVVCDLRPPIGKEFYQRDRGVDAFRSLSWRLFA